MSYSSIKRKFKLRKAIGVLLLSMPFVMLFVAIAVKMGVIDMLVFLWVWLSVVGCLLGGIYFIVEE